MQQECIPVGCVRSAAVTISPATHAPCHTCPRCHAHPLPRMLLSQCMPPFTTRTPLCHTCPSFAMHIPLFTIHAPLWTEFLTHACENITFPQLLLLMVIITLSKSSAVALALIIVRSILRASQHPLVRVCTSIKGVWLMYF